MKKAFGILQQIGKALMLPVAILPAAGILLGIGNAIQNPLSIQKLPFLGAAWLQFIAKIGEQAGGVVFSNLSLLFAVGVAVGLAEGEGVAGLAAIIGYLIMNITMGTILGITPEMMSNRAYDTVLGIPTLQTGVFGGIIIGVLAANLYKKYHAMELPPYLGFFAGKRFVPIITAASAILVGAAMVFIWPHIQHGLNTFSKSMIDSNRTLAAFVFGVIERSLIPFGLHHIFYSPFWFEFGEYVNKAGEVVRGDNTIFFAQIKDGVPLTAGTFMTGKFPFMMFGLPAAALAMYHEAKPEKRAIVGGIMASAALTSFLTGITEPIEFTFLFVAPWLFIVHALLAATLSTVMYIAGIVGIHSGGVIEMASFNWIPLMSSHWREYLLMFGIGIAFTGIWFVVFKTLILKFDVKTPGREDDEEDVKLRSKAEYREKQSSKGNDDKSVFVESILEGLGGCENIVDVTNCATRLRVNVKDESLCKSDTYFKSIGAHGCSANGKSFQVIIGLKVPKVRDDFENLLEREQKKAL